MHGSVRCRPGSRYCHLTHRSGVPGGHNAGCYPAFPTPYRNAGVTGLRRPSQPSSPCSAGTRTLGSRLVSILALATHGALGALPGHIRLKHRAHDLWTRASISHRVGDRVEQALRHARFRSARLSCRMTCASAQIGARQPPAASHPCLGGGGGGRGGRGGGGFGGPDDMRSQYGVRLTVRNGPHRPAWR